MSPGGKGFFSSDPWNKEYESGLSILAHDFYYSVFINGGKYQKKLLSYCKGQETPGSREVQIA